MAEAATDAPSVFVGSVRNATATAAAIDELLGAEASRVTIVASDEHWSSVDPGRSGIRTAFEDVIGAGLIAAELAKRSRTLSVEARSAAGAAEAHRSTLAISLADCIGGRELIAKGFPDDVVLASELNATTIAVCRADDGFFEGWPT